MTTETAAAPTPETVEFGSLRITFDDRVLRPRAWTAEQSAWGVELLEHAPEGPVLELCTGAGQIGLLAVADSPRPLVLVDADPVACSYARANADAAGRPGPTEVRLGALETAIAPGETFALVLADPPWVESARTDVFPEDPLTAIDGGSDGLDVAKACLAVAGEHLADGGSLVLQVGTPDQATALEQWLEQHPALRLAAGEVRDYVSRGTLLRVDRVTA